MEFLSGYQGREPAIVDLFARTFTAEEEGAIIGVITFSRLTYEQDQRTVFILAPVAVARDWQRKGIGQKLLAHGLAALRDAGVEIAMTYGDPNYYAKVGFRPVSEANAQAPFPLSQPEAGWRSR